MVDQKRRKEGYAQFGNVLTQMDDLANEDDERDAASAGYAALQALKAAMEDEVFDPRRIELDRTDDLIDPGEHDAGYMAAMTVAGGPTWYSGTDVAARRAFWEWWLNEALAIGRGD
jgi:hypothetical protein